MITGAFGPLSTMSFWVFFKGWIVEIIRRFWDRGEYRDVEWMQKTHTAWFEDWVEMRTYRTLEEFDDMASEFFPPSQVDEPVFTEEEEGETPLGGIMRLRAPWLDETNN